MNKRGETQAIRLEPSAAVDDYVDPGSQWSRLKKKTQSDLYNTSF